MKRILAILLFALPVSAAADHLDVIFGKYRRGVEVGGPGGTACRVVGCDRGCGG